MATVQFLARKVPSCQICRKNKRSRTSGGYPCFQHAQGLVPHVPRDPGFEFGYPNEVDANDGYCDAAKAQTDGYTGGRHLNDFEDVRQLDSRAGVGGVNASLDNFHIQGPKNYDANVESASRTIPSKRPATDDRASTSRLASDRLWGGADRPKKHVNKKLRSRKGTYARITAEEQARARRGSITPPIQSSTRPARHGAPDLFQKGRPPPDEVEADTNTSSADSHKNISARVSSSTEASEYYPTPLISQCIEDDDSEVEVLLQPQTKPISREQLVTEVKTIYGGLVSYEDKAMQLDDEQMKLAQVEPDLRKPLSKDQYQSYIALHKALIHEHHDLHLATQHPVASGELRRLPANYCTPARLWKHAVHTPLEVLRMRLPESKEHMVAFVLICFNMMTLFLETVPQFETMWLESIGDLARYRLALAENDDERETFGGIARYWYLRAVELQPNTSRLFHHLAILAPAYSVEQLSLYGRSLTGPMPFAAARKSLSAMLKPVISNPQPLSKKIPPALFAILLAHAHLCFGGPGAREQFMSQVDSLKSGLFREFVDDAAKNKADIKKTCTDVALANIVALMQYGQTLKNGNSKSIIQIAYTRHEAVRRIPSSARMSRIPETSLDPSPTGCLSETDREAARKTTKYAAKLAFAILSVALDKPDDENLHPLVHVMFAFLFVMKNVPAAWQELAPEVPWVQVRGFLNRFANAATMTTGVQSKDFPAKTAECPRPMTDDYALQGHCFTQGYLPAYWCKEPKLDQQERESELESMVATRLSRILWIGHKIALDNQWLMYHNETRSFEEGPAAQCSNWTGDERDQFEPLLSLPS